MTTPTKPRMKTMGQNSLKIFGLVTIIILSLFFGILLNDQLAYGISLLTPYSYETALDFINNDSGQWTRINGVTPDLTLVGIGIVMLGAWWLYNRYVFKVPLVKNPIPWHYVGAFLSLVVLTQIISIAFHTQPLEQWHLVLYESVSYGSFGSLEEIIFRGLLLGGVALFTNRKKTIFMWVIIGAVIFGIIHAFNIAEQSFVLTLYQVIFAIFAGINFGLFYIITGRLWLAVVIHTLWNMLATSLFVMEKPAIDIQASDLTLLDFANMAIIGVGIVWLSYTLSKLYLSDAIKTESIEKS